ncbi:MAG: DNA polymerase III subunit beta [Candidatus Jorgensenbacteria bacterium]|nr:DNA polymerase III subunit beta [Candidatus Jorgensenbacteria bacterium]
MKLIILKSNIIEGLNAVERAISSVANLPILKNLLIKTENGRILFTCTNLEIAITQVVPGKIIEDGEITVPVSVFAPVAKNLNAERISLEVKEKQILVTTDNYEASIQAQSAKDFPIIPGINEKENVIKMSASRFLEALQNVFVATQYSEIRPEISGVFFRVFDNEIILAATDSFRLAERIMKVENLSIQDDISMIIPYKTAEELTRFLSGEVADVEIFIEQNQVLFKTSSKQLISRLVDGSFPEYKAIIPKQIQNEATVNKNEFVNAIKLASSFSGKGNSVTISINENKKFLELSSSDSSLGENHYKIPIKFKGEAFTIVFNWRYLLEGTKIYSTEEIILGVNSPDRPAVLKSTNETGIVYVVMPIKS